MERDNINGKMVESTQENIDLIRNTDTDNIPGLMAEDILDNGRIVKDMGKEKSSQQMEYNAKVFGNKIEE